MVYVLVAFLGYELMYYVWIPVPMVNMRQVWQKYCIDVAEMG